MCMPRWTYVPTFLPLALFHSPKTYSEEKSTFVLVWINLNKPPSLSLFTSKASLNHLSFPSIYLPPLSSVSLGLFPLISRPLDLFLSQRQLCLTSSQSFSLSLPIGILGDFCSVSNFDNSFFSFSFFFFFYLRGRGWYFPVFLIISYDPWYDKYLGLFFCFDFFRFISIDMFIWYICVLCASISTPTQNFIYRDAKHLLYYTSIISLFHSWKYHIYHL